MNERADRPRELRVVQMRSFPLAEFQASRQHTEALLREFAIIVEGGGDHAALPKRLLDVVGSVRAGARGLNDAAEAVVEDAIERGLSHVDVEVRVPSNLAPGTRAFSALLDKVDEYCRAGELLTLTTEPNVRAFREWYLDQIASQLEGARPVSWIDWRATRS